MVPILHPCVKPCLYHVTLQLLQRGGFYFPSLESGPGHIRWPIQWGKSASVWVWNIDLKKPCTFLLALWRHIFQIRKKKKKIWRKTTLIWKDTCTPKFTAALFTTAKTWKQHKCPSTDEWIKKTWYLCMMEYSSVIKKDENFAICSNMDGLYAKWNKSEKNTVYHLYVDSKKHKKLVNLVKKQTYR